MSAPPRLPPPPPKEPTKAIAQAWPESLVDALDDIATEIGYSRRELCVYILTWGVEELQARRREGQATREDDESSS